MAGIVNTGSITLVASLIRVVNCQGAATFWNFTGGVESMFKYGTAFAIDQALSLAFSEAQYSSVQLLENNFIIFDQVNSVVTKFSATSQYVISLPELISSLGSFFMMSSVTLSNPTASLLSLA